MARRDGSPEGCLEPNSSCIPDNEVHVDFDNQWCTIAPKMKFISFNSCKSFAALEDLRSKVDLRDTLMLLQEPPWALRDHWAGFTVIRSLGKGSGAQESRPRAAILVPPETPVKTIVSGVDFVALDVLLGDR